MSTLKRWMSLAILCFVSNTIDAKQRIAYQKEWDYSLVRESLFFNVEYYQLSDEYHNVTFIVCDDHDDLLRSERNCTAVLGAQPKSSYCPVPFRNYNMRIFPFGSTRAVILWSDDRESGPIKCTILDFTSCQSKDVDPMKIYPDDHYSINVIDTAYFIDYNDSFELLILTGRYRYHVGLEGNIIAQYSTRNRTFPEFSPMTVGDDFRAVLVDSRPKAYLHFRGWNVSLIKLDGSITLLADSSIRRWKHVSTAHETIGLAAVVENRVNVTLFDLEGKLKLNTSVSYDFNPLMLELRNLADGGFLLAASVPGNTLLHLTRVDAEGKVVGSSIRVQLKSDSCACQERPVKVVEKMLENGEKEYCVMIDCIGIYMCPLSNFPRRFGFVMKCFTAEDF